MLVQRNTMEPVIQSYTFWMVYFWFGDVSVVTLHELCRTILSLQQGAPGRGNLCVSLVGCLSCPMPSPDLQPCWQSSAISVLRLHRVHITLSVLRTPRPRRCVLIHAAATAIASAPKMKKLHVKYDVPSRHKYTHDNRG